VRQNPFVDEFDDQVIDLPSYVKRKEAEASDAHSTFSFVGGEGERSRFALPLWRAAYLASGARAALVSLSADVVAGASPPEPLVVLDLREEPARMDFGAAALRGLAEATAPGTPSEGSEAVAVYLGQEDDRRWYLLIDDLEGASEMSGRARDDLLFLAGECSGLLFHRGLAADAGEISEE